MKTSRVTGGDPVGLVYQLLEKEGFTVGYSNERGNPVWVGYRLFAVHNPQKHKRLKYCRIDDRTTARVSHNDYRSSGYDSGHMAPNAAIDYCYGREAQKETFYMSNICPQEGNLNQGIWKELEAKVWSWANEYEQVWVFTGPVFDEKRVCICGTGVKIPSAFYKIIVDEINNSPRVLGFIIPQDLARGTELERWLEC